VAFGAIFAAAAAPAAAAAVDCIGLPHDAAERAVKGEYRDTSLAFIGTVGVVGADRAEISVENVLRGSVQQPTLALVDHPNAGIAVEFVPGVQYIVAAVQSPDGAWTTSACKGTRQIASEQDRRRLIALARNPSPPADTVLAGSPPLLVILLVTGLLAVGCYAKIRNGRNAGRAAP